MNQHAGDLPLYTAELVIMETIGHYLQLSKTIALWNAKKNISLDKHVFKEYGGLKFGISIFLLIKIFLN